jgi:hypothetical protein
MYLHNKADAKTFMIEDSNKENDFLMPPLFYYGKWFSVIGINKTFTADSAFNKYQTLAEEEKPNYVVFMQAENLIERIGKMQRKFPNLEYESTIEPSFIDKTLYFLNPLNDNQTAFIYKIK